MSLGAGHRLEDLTARCIRCGFCLEACPTFVLTGSELESPRGRIYLARSLDEGILTEEEIRPHLDRCLGCRACEPACPSGVEYGAILELTRARLGNSAARRGLLAVATNSAAMRAQALAGGALGSVRMPRFLARLLTDEPPQVDLPRRQAVDLPPLDASALPPVTGEVYFLEGCAMRALHPRVHASARRLLRRVGLAVRETSQGCCGSMHAHSGELGTARERAHALARAMPEDLPVVVDSAGCGSQMKAYGDLDPELGAFAARVVDLSEILLAHGLAERLAGAPGLDGTATYHDACHLAHGQGIRVQPRELLAAIPRLRLVPLPESDMCCGSAGVYNVLQPNLARELLDRKMANVRATGADVVVSGNPGCHAWIEQGSRETGGPVVLHTAEILEAAFLSDLAAFARPHAEA